VKAALVLLNFELASKKKKTMNIGAGNLSGRKQEIQAMEDNRPVAVSIASFWAVVFSFFFFLFDGDQMRCGCQL
jgi:hypothetical protein